ncbi:hypothetical protein TNCV_2701211 [Trichonephila clavipes]|nr:hypothetical protein TNCV_2701211 [Trichonephila clavipes]
MNSPVQLEAEKLEEFEDFKRTLKQNLAVHFVKKQEFRFTEKNRRNKEAPGKFGSTVQERYKFPASTNYNKHYEAPLPRTNNCSKISRQRSKGLVNLLVDSAFTEKTRSKQTDEEEWLNEGIIRPSSSEYASPIVMVKRKMDLRECASDYRKLNQKLGER